MHSVDFICDAKKRYWCRLCAVHTTLLPAFVFGESVHAPVASGNGEAKSETVPEPFTISYACSTHASGASFDQIKVLHSAHSVFIFAFQEQHILSVNCVRTLTVMSVQVTG